MATIIGVIILLVLWLQLQWTLEAIKKNTKATAEALKLLTVKRGK